MTERSNIENSSDVMRNLVGMSRWGVIYLIRIREQALTSKIEERKHFYIMKVIYISGTYI
jgi:hypothetical protein